MCLYGDARVASRGVATARASCLLVVPGPDAVLITFWHALLVDCSHRRRRWASLRIIQVGITRLAPLACPTLRSRWIGECMVLCLAAWGTRTSFYLSSCGVSRAFFSSSCLSACFIVHCASFPLACLAMLPQKWSGRWLGGATGILFASMPLCHLHNWNLFVWVPQLQSRGWTNSSLRFQGAILVHSVCLWDAYLFIH